MAKFKIGDKVKVLAAVDPANVGKTGVVIEVVENQVLADGSKATLYSVRLDGKPKKADGKDADHEADCLGCVRESDIK